MPTVQDFWDNTTDVYHSTTALYRFGKKLKALKPILRSLGKKKLHHLAIRVEEAHKILCEKLLLNLDNPSIASMEEETLAFKNWDQVAELEEGFLKQKSKLHWLHVGDKNNKYFYNGVKRRLDQNAIREIQCPNGSIATTQEDIKTKVVRFFEEFLTHQPVDHMVYTADEVDDLLDFHCSDRVQAGLLRTVTEEEIRSVLFNMPNNKAPGPDG